MTPDEIEEIKFLLIVAKMKENATQLVNEKTLTLKPNRDGSTGVKNRHGLYGRRAK